MEKNKIFLQAHLWYGDNAYLNIQEYFYASMDD